MILLIFSPSASHASGRRKLLDMQLFHNITWNRMIFQHLLAIWLPCQDDKKRIHPIANQCIRKFWRCWWHLFQNIVFEPPRPIFDIPERWWWWSEMKLNSVFNLKSSDSSHRTILNKKNEMCRYVMSGIIISHPWLRQTIIKQIHCLIDTQQATPNITTPISLLRSFKSFAIPQRVPSLSPSLLHAVKIA